MSQRRVTCHSRGKLEQGATQHHPVRVGADFLTGPVERESWERDMAVRIDKDLVGLELSDNQIYQYRVREKKSCNPIQVNKLQAVQVLQCENHLGGVEAQLDLREAAVICHSPKWNTCSET